jgi:DNA polymerase-3 subunit gamma/tau
MGEALYRKHRPKKLEDVVGQPHITSTLSNAIKNGRISHGYLFSGPRGVGKTSVARILAHQVNNFKYGDNHGSLDIIEIDAASNRRIDEIRDLRDKVHTAPVAGNYKVYIIDEVHMLTREAFNALLKTLEEPPAHVIFILATTEAHKLPETIISRTQHYTFKTVPLSEVIYHLKNLANQEDITITEDAIKLIAEHGEGSFRDSISLLDQLSAIDDIDTRDVEILLGLPPAELIDKLFNALVDNNLTTIIETINQATIRGIDSNKISVALSDKIRIYSYNNQSKELVELAQKLLTINRSGEPMRYLELILIEYVLDSNNPIVDAKKPKILKNIAIEKPKTKPPLSQKPAKEPEKNTTEKQTPQKQKKSSNNSTLKTPLNEDTYDRLLDFLKSKYNTLYGIARMASPSIKENVLVLKVAYPFHQKRLTEEKNATIIRNILTEINGEPANFKVEVVAKDVATSNNTKTYTPSDTLDEVTKIFGGGEVLDK